LSTYDGCLLRYKLQYQDEFIPVGSEPAAVSEKGLVFHEIAEQMTSSMSYEDLIRVAQERLSVAQFDTEKYPVIKSFPRFWQFWEKQVKSREALGFVVSKEGWQNFSIGKVDNFVGAIDLMLRGADGTIYIYDYKSGGTAKISDEYARQLMIYALAAGQKMGYDLETIVDKIHCSLFFPLAGLKDEELTDSTVAAKASLKNLKTLEFTVDDLKGVINKVNEVYDATELTDWTKVDGMSGDISYACSWCPFCGSIKSQSKCDNFTPCELSYKSGMRSQRGISFVIKEKAKSIN
jgi:hypothetical protein